MSRAKFEVFGEPRFLDGQHRATVVIDRRLGLVSVRPYRRKRTFEYPLVDVAGVVISKVYAAEKREREALKKARRKR
jgi:hypothetical protein